MKTKRTSVEWEAGDLHGSAWYDDAGTLVGITCLTEAGEVQLKPETVERIAEVSQQLRRDAGDWRGLCVDHGFKQENHTCLTCAAEKAAAEKGKAEKPKPKNGKGEDVVVKRTGDEVAF